MRKSLWFLVVCILFIGTSSVSAKTPDGQTPSRETVCDMETGAAFGLCNAYCEAMDCTDPNQRASNRGCESVRENFEKHTGRPLPCTMTCPCPEALELFAEIVSGSVEVTRCVYTDNTLVLRTMDGTGNVEDGPPPNCNINNDPTRTLVLTEQESLICRVQLRALVESMGVQCIQPE